jgi:hypothetical protein
LKPMRVTVIMQPARREGTLARQLELCGEADLSEAARLVIDLHGSQAQGFCTAKLIAAVRADDRTGLAIWIRLSILIDDVSCGSRATRH